jgi:hypothetical protein
MPHLSPERGCTHATHRCPDPDRISGKKTAGVMHALIIYRQCGDCQGHLRGGRVLQNQLRRYSRPSYQPTKMGNASEVDPNPHFSGSSTLRPGGFTAGLYGDAHLRAGLGFAITDKPRPGARRAEAPVAILFRRKFRESQGSGRVLRPREPEDGGPQELTR